MNKQMIAVLAGNRSQAQVWLIDRTVKVGGDHNVSRATMRTLDGATEYRYVGTAYAALGVDWTGMELVGAWGERTDPVAHAIYTTVFDRIVYMKKFGKVTVQETA